MRNKTLTISSLGLTLLLSGIAAAQTPASGTTNQTPQVNQPVNGNGGYIVSTPTISLGDGITPTVVTNQDTVNVTLPQNTSVNGQVAQTATPTEANSANAAQGAQSNANGAAKHFDFIRSESGDGSSVSGTMADNSVSLGEVARQMRNGKQIAKRNLTNADVDAMNSQNPGGSGNGSPDANGNAMASPSSQQNSTGMSGMTSNQNNGGTAGAVQPQSSTPAYAQPSTRDPFGNPATRVNDGTKPNAQQGEGISPRSSSRPADNQPTDSTQGSQDNSSSGGQLPKSSSSLPLLGTLGALSTLAGICYFKMR